MNHWLPSKLRICLVACVSALSFGDAKTLGQLSINDLRAGYRENILSVQANLRFSIDVSTETPAEYKNAMRDYEDALRAAISTITDGPRKDAATSTLEGLVFRSGMSEKGIRQAADVILNDDNLRCRFIAGTVDEIPIDPLNFEAAESQSPLTTLVRPHGSEFSALFHSSKRHGIVGSILGFSETDSEFETIRRSCFPMPFGKNWHAKSVAPVNPQNVHPLEILYPSGILESRIDAKVDVKQEGRIAIVTIREEPKMLATEDGLLIGLLVYAEIELDKGFLPRTLKYSTIGKFDQEYLVDAAQSYWRVQVEFENKELAGVGFYPAKIVQTEFARIRPSEKEIDFLKSTDPLDQIRHQLHSPLGTEDKLMESSQTTRQVSFIEKWVPVNANNVFSLEPPPNISRFFDKRTGKVQVKESIENTLKLDLDQIPSIDKSTTAGSGIQESSAKRRWFLAFISIACLGVLYFAVRSGQKRVENG